MTQEQVEKAIEGAHAPETSYWPIVLAATLTLALVGLVVHFAVTLVGAALSLVAMVAWVVERFQGPSQGDQPPAGRMHLPSSGVAEANVQALAYISRRPGWWGLVWFITSEAIFFANLIVAYLYLRVSSRTWPSPGTPRLELLFPSVNTAILLLSGVPAFYAHRAIKRGDSRGLQMGCVLAALLGAIFLAGQGYEYTKFGLAPQSSVFAAGFFVLTGFHGAHVVAGIGLLLFVSLLSLRGRFSAQSNFAVTVASNYWHFVDIVWIFLFTILYLIQ